jgi:anti-anti-sigma factor
LAAGSGCHGDSAPLSRLDEALTARYPGQAVQLTIDATNLRYADSASIRTLTVAAMKVRTQEGSVTLLNPQPPVARILDLLCADGMFSIRLPSPFGSSKIYFPNGPGLTHGIGCLPTRRNRRSDRSPPRVVRSFSSAM